NRWVSRTGMVSLVELTSAALRGAWSVVMAAGSDYESVGSRGQSLEPLRAAKWRARAGSDHRAPPVVCPEPPRRIGRGSPMRTSPTRDGREISCCAGLPTCQDPRARTPAGAGWPAPEPAETPRAVDLGRAAGIARDHRTRRKVDPE